MKAIFGLRSAPPTEHAAVWNLVPIALMCGWLGQLIIFWMAVWGPMRPFDAAGPLTPAPTAYALALPLCLAAGWAPAAYLRPRRWETDGRLYEMLGVRAFRRLVPNGDWVNRIRRRRDPHFRVVSHRRAAAAYVARTEEGERTHGVLLLAGLVSSVYARRIGWDGWCAFLTVGNVLVNLYPMLLQRYTRARLYRLLARGRARAAASA
jgi:hypothetical protein